MSHSPSTLRSPEAEIAVAERFEQHARKGEQLTLATLDSYLVAAGLFIESALTLDSGGSTLALGVLIACACITEGIFAPAIAKSLKNYFFGFPNPTDEDNRLVDLLLSSDFQAVSLYQYIGSQRSNAENILTFQLIDLLSSNLSKEEKRDILLDSFMKLRESGISWRKAQLRAFRPQENR